MRSVVYLIVASAIAVTGAAASLDAQREGADASRARTILLSFQGRMRQYVLHAPAAANGSLVLVFHGGGQTAFQIQQMSGFDGLAEREHFIVAYPQAFDRSWADGRNVTSAERQGTDDVGFAKAVVLDIARTHAFDRSRVFATGLSNGAALSHRLACEAADTFAGIASVAGGIATNLVRSCRPSAPVAVVGIQGLADPSVPFDGGYVGGSVAGGRVEGSRATEELWRSLNGCAPQATSEPLPARVRDGTSATRRSYSNCRGHGDVVWYEIEGGGHRWPPHLFEGPSEALAQRENGVSSQNVDASAVIWTFFAAHGRR